MVPEPVVVGQFGALLAGGYVPDPRVALAAGGEPSAIRRDRHRVHRTGVADQGGALLACGHVPDPYRSIPAAGGDPGAVR